MWFLSTLRRQHIPLVVMLVVLFLPAMLFAQTTPMETTANKLRDFFTGPVAQAFSIVAIAVGGYVMMFGDGTAKRMLAGIIAGISLAIGAARWFDAFFK
jgi:type IV secretory pathway VirB2 component (pilin)